MPFRNKEFVKWKQYERGTSIPTGLCHFWELKGINECLYLGFINIPRSIQSITKSSDNWPNCSQNLWSREQIIEFYTETNFELDVKKFPWAEIKITYEEYIAFIL